MHTLTRVSLWYALLLLFPQHRFVPSVVQPRHIGWPDHLGVEVGVAGHGVYGEGLDGLVELLWGGLGQALVDGLPLAQELHNGLTLAQPLDHPGCVHGAEETTSTPCAYGPEGLVGEEGKEEEREEEREEEEREEEREEKREEERREGRKMWERRRGGSEGDRRNTKKRF